MRIPRIDTTVEACEAHLTAATAFGTEIESLLTQSLLVIICAEFEQAIEALIDQRCASVNDPALQEFFRSCVDAVFRSAKSSEIAGLLNRFGPPFKNTFKELADENPRAVAYYNNIITNRHGVAHSDGTNATFREVKEFYEEGHVVLDYFRTALFPA